MQLLPAASVLPVPGGSSELRHLQTHKPFLLISSHGGCKGTAMRALGAPLWMDAPWIDPSWDSRSILAPQATFRCPMPGHAQTILQEFSVLPQNTIFLFTFATQPETKQHLGLSASIRCHWEKLFPPLQCSVQSCGELIKLKTPASLGEGVGLELPQEASLPLPSCQPPEGMEVAEWESPECWAGIASRPITSSLPARRS